jgi:hypothetical protein
MNNLNHRPAQRAGTVRASRRYKCHET